MGCRPIHSLPVEEELMGPSGKKGESAQTRNTKQKTTKIQNQGKQACFWQNSALWLILVDGGPG